MPLSVAASSNRSHIYARAIATYCTIKICQIPYTLSRRAVDQYMLKHFRNQREHSRSALLRANRKQKLDVGDPIFSRTPFSIKRCLKLFTMHVALRFIARQRIRQNSSSATYVFPARAQCPAGNILCTNHIGHYFAINDRELFCAIITIIFPLPHNQCVVEGVVIEGPVYLFSAIPHIQTKGVLYFIPRASHPIPSIKTTRNLQLVGV